MTTTMQLRDGEINLNTAELHGKKKRPKLIAVRVMQLKKGLKPRDAYFTLSCRNKGKHITGWSYDSITGKARVF